jgi:hypothetical protein
LPCASSCLTPSCSAMSLILSTSPKTLLLLPPQTFHLPVRVEGHRVRWGHWLTDCGCVVTEPHLPQTPVW